MSTGIESPQSVSAVVYYRGVSMTITQRDVEANVRAIVENMMKEIDRALDQDGCKPSWNEDTNKQALTPKVTQSPTTQVKPQPMSVEQYENREQCEKCGADMGISRKGNKYCLKKCWLAGQQG